MRVFNSFYLRFSKSFIFILFRFIYFCSFNKLFFKFYANFEWYSSATMHLSWDCKHKLWRTFFKHSTKNTWIAWGRRRRECLTELAWTPHWGIYIYIFFKFMDRAEAASKIARRLWATENDLWKVENWFLLLIHWPWHPLPGNSCNALTKRSRSKLSSDRRMRKIAIRQLHESVSLLK